MRDLEFGRVHDGVAIEDDIDIDSAGAVADGPSAFELALDAMDSAEEL
jgi:hypothetical protein